MFEKALEVLKEFTNNGYSAYIVGGYVRDFLLKRETIDIDICTSATPKEIASIFKLDTVMDKEYGSAKINYKGYKFDITTYRKEKKYLDNRRPSEIEYIDNVKDDLLRRDFTINTFCMDSDENVLDMLAVLDDLNKKVIKTVGDPKYRIKEDCLRILRAIRFATILDFDIDKNTKFYLKKYGYLLKHLSFNRKKEELDKIFTSVNKEKGINLILELKLDKYLEIDNLKNLMLCDNTIGLWAQMNVSSKYPFSSLEMEQMEKIRELMSMNIYDKYVIYKYGLYLTTIVCEIKGLDKKLLNEIRNSLAITKQSDIDITALQISDALLMKPGKYIKDIFSDLEENIVIDNLENRYEVIKDYIISKYSESGK